MKHAGTTIRCQTVGGPSGSSQLSPGRGSTEMISDDRPDANRKILVKGVVAELERQGMQILDQNWRCRLGEIDIVAAEAGPSGLTLVFCEVKCRSGLGFGHSP
jgi:hypothetical protein